MAIATQPGYRWMAIAGSVARTGARAKSCLAAHRRSYGQGAAT